MTELGGLRRWLPALLFLATLVTTTWAQGPAYALTLLSILGAHEMGHYWVARWHRVPASLPHFIPVPPIFGFFLGTMGAVISMDGSAANRRQLLEIGAAGPIAGFVVALPAMVLGLQWSTPAQADPTELATFGQSLLSYVLEAWVGPPLNDEEVLLAHPVYVAAWAGFLVTALNLLPMGQFDGGHVVYALAPNAALGVARMVFGLLAVLGLAGVFVLLVLERYPDAPVGFLVPYLSPTLLIWALLGYFVGLAHPDGPEGPALGLRHRSLAVLCLAIFVACFIPSPLYVAPAGT